VVTGNPIRKEILLADREKSRRELGVDGRICLLTFGGSLGAERINQAVADVVAAFHKGGQIHHIHAMGQYGTELFPDLLQIKGVDIADNPHYDIREYISDMPRCLAAADLVVCRAGAISLSELQATGRASILIPSPNVAENHQYHNAMVLANRGAAVVIEEKDLTGERLVAAIKELVSDPQEIENLGRNASAMAIADGAERIVAEIVKINNY
jgi:UDP-N-acetylglucosamine--N-acetylmuramyl-(pentapeptide) pyrophosphoryl-undecaprenol N-acetylglucosamine transferase